MGEPGSGARMTVLENPVGEAQGAGEVLVGWAEARSARVLRRRRRGSREARGAMMVMEYGVGGSRRGGDLGWGRVFILVRHCAARGF